jgi:hypothetical protein
LWVEATENVHRILRENTRQGSLSHLREEDVLILRGIYVNSGARPRLRVGRMPRAHGSVGIHVGVVVVVQIDFRLKVS